MEKYVNQNGCSEQLLRNNKTDGDIKQTLSCVIRYGWNDILTLMVRCPMFPPEGKRFQISNRLTVIAVTECLLAVECPETLSILISRDDVDINRRIGNITPLLHYIALNRIDLAKVMCGCIVDVSTHQILLNDDRIIPDHRGNVTVVAALESVGAHDDEELTSSRGTRKS